MFLVVLLEISAFIRETYPQIVKKATKQNNRSRDNRGHIGSLFSNESSSASVLNDFSSPEMQQNCNNFNENDTIISANNIGTNHAITNINTSTTNNNNNLDSDTVKHIKFAFCPSKEDDSFSSVYTITQTNTDAVNEHDTTIQSFSQQLTTKSNPKIVTNTSKRSSLRQPKRSSLKYRTDRTNRLARRKLSHGQQVIDLAESQGVTGNSGNLTCASSSEHYVTNNVLPNTSNYLQPEIEFIEGEAVNISKCFPWINVSTFYVINWDIKLIQLINGISIFYFLKR